MSSEWTVDTLKEHMDVRFEAVKEAISKADTVGEQRANKLETATAARFESVNEFRNQTKDLQANFMPRAEFDAQMKAMNEKIQAKNMQVVVSLSAGLLGLVLGVFTLASRFG